MKIAIGSDHAGYVLKEDVKKLLDVVECEIHDVGTQSEEPVDYPDFAGDVARAVSCALAKLLADWTAIGGHWSVFHVLSHSPSSRIPIRKAQRILGYRPDFGGQES